MRNEAVNRVLIYRLGSLGDTLIALPVFHLINRVFPNAERRLLTNFPVNSKAPSAAAVLGSSGLVHSYQGYPVGVRNWRTLMRLRADIRAWRPDLLVYLTVGRGRKAALRDAAFFHLCGVRRLIGVPYAGDLQHNLWFEDRDEFEPEASRLARCVKELGDSRLDDAESWDLRLTQEERAAADRALQGAESRPVLALSVGTKVQAKDWGIENWKALAARLALSYPGYALALAGAPEEAEASEAAANAWRAASTAAGPAINLCGLTTPRESAAVFARAELFVGHDSGPMHLAASVQTPCVAIFAARNKPAVWFPYGKQHQIIYHRTDCWGCGLETCIAQGKKCLASVAVEEVLERIGKALPPPLSMAAAALDHAGTAVSARVIKPSPPMR